jgi:tRNA threonylcarbamoyladenosine biosynthesis protein TsaE
MIVETQSAEETRALGRRLGEALAPGDVVALVGDLGAGKTQFAKGVAWGLGLADTGVVTSPTFVLMNSYELRVPLRHYDLYRLESVDLESLSYYELRDTSAVVVEWAEKAGDALGDRLEVRFETTGATSRRLTFRAMGERARRLLTVL